MIWVVAGGGATDDVSDGWWLDWWWSLRKENKRRQSWKQGFAGRAPDKYVPMLTIRDDNVNNNFSDKFLPLSHVDYSINSDGRKLIAGYICRTFYTFEE